MGFSKGVEMDNTFYILMSCLGSYHMSDMEIEHTVPVLYGRQEYTIRITLIGIHNNSFEPCENTTKTTELQLHSQYTWDILLKFINTFMFMLFLTWFFFLKYC